MWLVRAQWGSPARAAQALLESLKTRNDQKPPRRPAAT
jgi:hypothetical protein